MRSHASHRLQAITTFAAGICLLAVLHAARGMAGTPCAPPAMEGDSVLRSPQRWLPGGVPGVDTAAAPAAAAEEGRGWDARGRLQFGVSWLRMHAGAGLLPLLYIAANYRVSTNPGAEGDRRLRLGVGGEIGLFYLYPYLRLGPELRWGNAVAEAHAGAAAVFLVGPVTPAGAGGLFAGGSLGFILPGGDLDGFEFNVGFDYIQLLNTARAATPMPYLSAAMRF
ncbi:MAG TPA: hypothetical protein VHI13_17765 [Candidatus Kapabacteria bacterium]|nr:hypothetical protein [Candidatus Kapabacteria bacterium]